jgi:hypothetical protein
VGKLGAPDDWWQLFEVPSSYLVGFRHRGKNGNTIKTTYIFCAVIPFVLPAFLLGNKRLKRVAQRLTRNPQ